MYRQPKKRRRRKAELSQNQRDEIVELHAHQYGSRRIAARVGWSRKIVSRVLHEEGCLPSRPREKPSLLDHFRELIQGKVKEDLTISRILREIREQGYQGGRTILATYIRPLRAELCLAPAKKVKRRFETAMGREMQIDWSPYKVIIAGSIVTVHALGVLMCASRKLWVHFFRNERQPILLEGLAGAFEYFGGCAMRCVLDYVSGHIVELMCPSGICGGEAPSDRTPPQLSVAAAT